MTDIRDILGSEEEKKIVQQIQEAERNTSGEIRVHMEDHCKGDLMDRASYVFDQLEINKTKDRNGVLLYFAVKDHRAAILGDKGINAAVEEGYWDEKLFKIIEHFKQGAFFEGISQTISDVGQKLKTHFPLKDNDKNELSDEISYEQ